MSTFETIDFEDFSPDDSNRKHDDLSSVFVGFFATLNYKILFFIFIIFLFISSDVFIDKALSNIDGSVEYKTPNTKGTFIQGILLVFLYMIIDLVIKLGFI